MANKRLHVCSGDLSGADCDWVQALTIERRRRDEVDSISNPSLSVCKTCTSLRNSDLNYLNISIPDVRYRSRVQAHIAMLFHNPTASSR